MVRIMVLAGKSALWWGVRKVLQEGGHCDLVAWETDIDQALERIHELRPDVILVDKDDEQGNTAATPLRILGEGAGMHVIALGLKDNILCLYSGQCRTIDDAEDLIRAIEDARTVFVPGDDA